MSDLFLVLYIGRYVIYLILFFNCNIISDLTHPHLLLKMDMDGLSGSEIFFSQSHDDNSKRICCRPSPVSEEVPNKRRRLLRLSDWRDWPGLPKDILFNIIDRLTAVEDLVRFGCVCPSWQSVFLQNAKKIHAPFLLIAPPLDEDEDDDEYDRMALYSVSNTRVYSFRIELPDNKVCCGSSFGWLVTVEKKNCGYNVQLYNPFLNRTLMLPHNILLQRAGATIGIRDLYFIRKAVLCSDPMLSHNFTVMAIMGGFSGLAFFKPGNCSWTSIGRHRSSASIRSKMYSDITFFHSAGQFYALRVDGSVFAVTFLPEMEEPPKVTKVAPRLKVKGSRTGSKNKMYLVEDLSTGDLLQVHRNNRLFRSNTDDQNHGMTLRFLVFKFDPLERKWTRMLHFEDKIFFLGNNSSILRTASDCPGCVPNCIYYTDDNDDEWCVPEGWNKPPPAGIYNLEDDSVQSVYMLDDSTDPWNVWLEPNFSGLLQCKTC